MQKILFSRSNVIKIKSDVQSVCFLYNQIKDSDLKNIIILDAVSVVFGYKNWAQLVAVNKENRPYLSFSFSVSSHVRTIISNLSKLITIDSTSLMIAVSLVELQIKSLDHMYLIDCRAKSATHLISANFKQTNCNNNLIWFTDNISEPERHLAIDPLASLIYRNGLTLLDLTTIFPEFGRWLKSSFSLSDEFVLMFNHPVWWDYNDVFSEDVTPTSLLEIHVRHKEQISVCYHPIYLDDGADFYEEVSATFEQGVAYCQAVEHEPEKHSYFEHVNYSLKFLGDQKHIVSIKFLIPESSHDSHIHKIITHYDQVRITDFTAEIGSWEPRYKFYNSDRIIESEFWIYIPDIEKIKEVNKRVYENLQSITGTLQYEWIMKSVMPLYLKAKYSFKY